MTIGVIIPTIPPRKALLLRAMTSVGRQTLLPDDLSVAVSAIMRQYEMFAVGGGRWIVPFPAPVLL